MNKESRGIKDRHAGSMTSIILGVLLALSNISAVAQGMNNDISSTIGGLCLVFGAIAYRMAKKRILGVTNPSIFRLVIEITCIVLSMAIVLMQNNLAYTFQMNPFTIGFIPLCVVITYGFLLFQKKTAQ
tara:strand:+ start:234 stop:620 length:387 start_codon:yes stop_codon:yes gene_type:complete